MLNSQAPGISSIAPQFLHRILPFEGPYVAWIKFADGRSFNAFARTVADLWQVLQRYDQRGASVYHACARFKEAKLDPKGLPLRERRFGRTNHNVAELKALFLDVDAGPSEVNKPPKPYRDGREAADATLEFCRLAQLPVPVFVASGNGLHAYWPLANPMAPEEWQRYARGLRSLCNKFGLKADPARTTDVCSVLRTPGTHNRKDGLTKEVKCAGLYGPYPVESFEALAKCEDAQRPKKSILARLGPKPAYLRNCPTKALKNPQMEPPPASAMVIADRCAQVRALRVSRGNLPEPLWYAVLAVMSRCTDGDVKAHEWSAGYDGYSAAETQERLDRTRCLTGATRCERFRALNPKGCRRCAWSQKITSPIQLGWPR